MWPFNINRKKKEEELRVKEEVEARKKRMKEVLWNQPSGSRSSSQRLIDPDGLENILSPLHSLIHSGTHSDPVPASSTHCAPSHHSSHDSGHSSSYGGHSSHDSGSSHSSISYDSGSSSSSDSGSSSSSCD